MPLALDFVILFILSFALLLYFLRPTRTQVAVQRHLEELEESRTTGLESHAILKDERISPIPWVAQLIKSTPGSAALLRLIHQSGTDWHIGPLILSSVLVAILTMGIVSVWTSSIVFGLGIGAVAGASPFLYLYLMKKSRMKRCDILLPEAVDLMSRALRAGHTVSSALEMVGKETAEPLASEFRIVYEQQSLGLPLRDAILNLAERGASEDMRFLATALLVQKETGGNLTQILDKATAVMRERVRLRGQVRIYTAQGRASGWILCALPFALFVVISILNPSYERVLFTDPLGKELIYLGLVMMTIGILVVRRIIRIRI